MFIFVVIITFFNIITMCFIYIEFQLYIFTQIDWYNNHCSININQHLYDYLLLYYID